MQIYNNIFKGFNLTVGKVIRFFQAMSLTRRKIDIHDLLYEKALRDTADIIYTNMQEAIFFAKREELWKWCTNKSNLQGNLKKESNFFAEFGSWKGYSINYFSSLLPKHTIHGFDSFFGLPVDWSGTEHRKGHFNLDGKLPRVNKNVILHPGLFKDTIPKFLENNKGKKAGIIHIDSDTYEAAIEVLLIMKPTIKKETIIIFDEFFGYPNWKAHEFKAWQEFSAKNKIEFKFIAYTQVAAAIIVC